MNTGQSAGRSSWVPAVFRGYRREWLWSDVVAGLTGVVMIPPVIAYARLMGLPPACGLYASLVPLLVYPLLGSSRLVIVGPDIALSLLMASAITPLANGDPSHAAMLAATLSLFSGLLLLLGARAGIGGVADFLSKPVLAGFMTGAALILVASQLGGLLGIPLKNNDFFPRLVEAAGQIKETNISTLLFGVSLLLLLLALRRFAPKVPGALTVCVTAMVVSAVFRLEDRGVAVVGAFPRGLPAFKFPTPEWREIQTLLPAAVGLALLSYTEGILLARAFAAKNGDELNPNRELASLGVADICAGMFQGFCVTGSQSRTAVNDAAGGKTQVASLVAAAALAVFLLFLTPVLAHLPVVALAAILIRGGFSLVEIDSIKRIYRYYPRAAGVAALTTAGVLAGGVVPGILVGVVLSLLGVINRLSHPPGAVLREIPGHGFHDLGENGPGQVIPGLVAYRFYAPLVFCNCGHFAQRVRELVANNPTPVRWFLLDAQAITDIDVTAAEMIHALHEEMRGKGVAMKIAHANPPLRAILERTGLAREIGEESFFSSVHDCADAFAASGATTKP